MRRVALSFLSLLFPFLRSVPGLCEWLDGGHSCRRARHSRGLPARSVPCEGVGVRRAPSRQVGVLGGGGAYMIRVEKITRDTLGRHRNCE